MNLHPPDPSPSPWQWLYRRGHDLRRRWMRPRAAHLPRPVLSVGNLHWGGTGKTPVVAAIARHLRDRGLRIAILSRGYRSRGQGVRIVSRGEGPLLGPLVAGDEPVLLASELPGVAVVVDPDRHKAGLHALERLTPAPDLFLLDDGFSHIRLRRDIDIVLLPADDPFGGGRLPPSGRLREPLESLRDAHAVLLAGSEEGGAQLAAGLRRYGFRGPGFASAVRNGAPRIVGGEPPRAGARTLVVSGIARGHRFHRAAQGTELEIVGKLDFPDHHAYPEASLREIGNMFRETGAELVLTTTKDHVKLLGRLELPLAELPIESDPEPEFWRWLDSTLRALDVG